MNCGSSSMLKRRKTRPTGVIRGSFRSLNSWPSHSLLPSRLSSFLSASATIVRSFNIENGLPLNPMRSDE